MFDFDRFGTISEQIKEALSGLKSDDIQGFLEQADRESRFPAEVIQHIHQSGVMAVNSPHSFGGMGAGHGGLVILLSEVAQYSPATAQILCMHLCAMPFLCRQATTEPQMALVREILGEGKICAFPMSEPGTGNKLWHMSSFGVRDGDTISFNAVKSIVTSAGVADYYIVAVRDGELASSNELVLSLVPASTPGIEAKKAMDSLGMRGSSSAPMTFDIKGLSSDFIFGEPEATFAMLMAYSYPPYMLGLAAVYYGIARRCYDIACDHVQKRRFSDNNLTLSEHETIQAKIAQMRFQLSSLSAWLQHTAHLCDEVEQFLDHARQNGQFFDVISQSDDEQFIDLVGLKVVASQTAETLAVQALDLCGGQAYCRGHAVERFLRDAFAGRLQGPANATSEVLAGKLILGLGLPWEQDAA